MKFVPALLLVSLLAGCGLSQEPPMPNREQFTKAGAQPLVTRDYKHEVDLVFDHFNRQAIHQKGWEILTSRCETKERCVIKATHDTPGVSGHSKFQFTLEKINRNTTRVIGGAVVRERTPLYLADSNRVQDHARGFYSGRNQRTLEKFLDQIPLKAEIQEQDAPSNG